MHYLVLLLCLAFHASFATTQDEAADFAQCEMITLANENVLCIKQGIGPFSLRARINAIEAKLKTLSKNKTFDPEKLEIREHKHSTDIMADETIIATLSDDDVDPSLGKTHNELAELVIVKMQKAIKADRAQNAPQEILWGMAYTLFASLVLLVLLKSFSHFYPKIYSFIRSNEGRYINSIKFRNIELLNSARIVEVLLWLARSSRFVLTVVLLYIYLPLVLSFFPWTANWTPKLYSYIIDPFTKILKVAVDFIPNVFFILVIIFITRYVLKLVFFVFHEIEMGRLEFEGFYKDWAIPTYKLVRVLIMAFALIMIFPYVPGSESPAFQGVSVFIGVLLSLGSTSAVANIIAGLVITYMRPFRVGDRVKIADTIGDILEKNLLVTRIRSIKNVDITIPNSMVLGSHIINYSSTAKTEGLVLNTTVTIGYDAPWRIVHELLIKAAAKTELITKDKKPFVLQTALNDFYVSYELNAYTHVPNKMALIYSELHQNIQDCFNEAGVEIMSPHYGALRDGNETTIPSDYRAADYEVPGFKLKND